MSDLVAVQPETNNTDIERVVAEIKAAVVSARSCPRDVIGARDRIIADCRRPSLAEAAVYAFPRGGETVTGPSIVLATAIAARWGNMQCGTREISRTKDESTVEAYAWDCETNTRISRIFTVPHLRVTKTGSYKLTDPRDIYELVANMGSRRLRACILQVIPTDIVEDAVKECTQTLENVIGATPEALKKMVDAFGAMGVKPKQIEARLGHNLDSTIVAEIRGLKNLYASIKDGYSAVEDVFPPIEAKQTVKDAAKAKAAAAAQGAAK